jgi:hypothetical protein
MVWAVAYGLINGCPDLVEDISLPVGSDVPAGFGDIDGFLAELNRQKARDARIEWWHAPFFFKILEPSSHVSGLGFVFHLVSYLVTDKGLSGRPLGW